MFDAQVLQERVSPQPHKIITDSINRSQHAQRNYNRDLSIPKKDIDQMLHAVTQCPSKQNVGYYKIHMITNKDVIDDVYKCTEGFTYWNEKKDEWEMLGNTQILSNLVVVFEKLPIDIKTLSNEPEGYTPPNGYRHSQHYELATTGKLSESSARDLHNDQITAIGIAAGYLNLTAAILGYRTGCCSCFHPAMVKETLDLEHDPFLLMGIGYPNEGINRRQHPHRDDVMFCTMKKQPIPVNHID